MSLRARLSLTLRRLAGPEALREWPHLACALVRPRCPCLWGAE